MSLISAANLQWLDSEETVFICDVEDTDYPSETLIHVCREDDSYTGYPDLWTNAVVNGDYGVIAAYVPPTLSENKVTKAQQFTAQWSQYVTGHSVTTTVSSIKMRISHEVIQFIDYLITQASGGNVGFIDAENKYRSISTANADTVLSDMKSELDTKYALFVGDIDDIEQAADQTALDAITPSWT